MYFAKTQAEIHASIYLLTPSKLHIIFLLLLLHIDTHIRKYTVCMCVCDSLIVANTALTFHHKRIISCILHTFLYLLSIWVISSPLFLATIVFSYIGAHVWGKPKDWSCITIWPNANQHFLHIPQLWHSQSERYKCTHELEQNSDLARRHRSDFQPKQFTFCSVYQAWN